MKESLHRERCFAYLLGQLDETDELLFEVRLEEDQGLRAELRRCSDDLAAFSERSSEQKVPSAFVWAGIEEELFGGSNGKKRVVAGNKWWQSAPVWISAACLLLLLNLGLLVFRSNSEGDGIESNRMANYDDSLKAANGGDGQLEGGETFGSEESGIENMSERLAELRGRLAAQSRIQAIEKRKMLDMERERRVLVAQIDSLERDILEYVGLATESQSREELGKRRSVKVVVAGDEVGDAVGEDAPDIWTRLRQVLPEGNLAIIDFQQHYAFSEEKQSFESRSAAVELGGAFRQFESPPLAQMHSTEGMAQMHSTEVESTPYLVSMLSDEGDQAILSLGNLPPIGRDSEYRVWNRSEETGEFEPLGSIAQRKWERTLNVAVQLDEGAKIGEDFLISVEPEGEKVTHPTRILIRP